MPSATRSQALAIAVLTALLAACGGGGGGSSGDPLLSGNPPPPSSRCEAGPRKAALRSYFDEWYFWHAISPKPNPDNDSTLSEFFQSLRYPGGDASFPADRWSYYGSTAAFEQLFGEGRTLGYGVSVNGVETAGQPDLPLHIRHVEPKSPAALAGLARGDRIRSANGRSAAEIIRSGDFTVLTPSVAGQTLVLSIGRAGDSREVTREVTLLAADFPLVPVTDVQAVTSPKGRRVGYLAVKDMISQAIPPATEAIAGFKAAGVSELVLDLRYNGGGLVSVGRDLASLIAGARGEGRLYAELRYNDRKAAYYNARYAFDNPPQALGLQRVYVLAGERTCSAAEQLANGLRGVMEVVVVGRTSCGKPVGFNPSDDGCGLTYSVVNFESVNALGEGRYFDGLRPQCVATEDFTQPIGAPSEPFLAVALKHLDGGGCVAPATAGRPRVQSVRVQRALADEGERPAMIPR